MATRKILQLGDPALRVVAKAVAANSFAHPTTQNLIDDLIETMRDAQGSGLAATQIGVPLRICVLEVKKNPRYPYKPLIPLTIMINPTWEPIGDETYENIEGCLSVIGLRGRVSRAKEIRITYVDRLGVEQSMSYYGLRAGTVQHEVDHLDGLLFTDRVEDRQTLTTWENFNQYQKEEWLKSLQPMLREESRRSRSAKTPQ